MGFKISAVFPAYNEAANIDQLVAAAGQALERLTEEYEIIVVDDGSSDGTGELVQRLIRQRSGVRLVHHPENLGYAAALRDGFRAAKLPLIFYSDADNQFRLEEIALLLERIEEADIVTGYRQERRDNVLRKVLSFGYNGLVRLLFGLRYRDIDCAFKLYRREVFDRITIESRGFLVDLEVLAKAELLGLRIAEVGVTHLPRPHGRTTIRPGHFIQTLAGLLTLKKALAGFKRGQR